MPSAPVTRLAGIPKSNCAGGDLGDFLNIFLSEGLILRAGGEEETKVVDPQHQTPPHRSSVGAAMGHIPHRST